MLLQFFLFSTYSKTSLCFPSVPTFLSSQTLLTFSYLLLSEITFVTSRNCKVTQQFMMGPFSNTRSHGPANSPTPAPHTPWCWVQNFHRPADISLEARVFHGQSPGRLGRSADSTATVSVFVLSVPHVLPVLL